MELNFKTLFILIRHSVMGTMYYKENPSNMVDNKWTPFMIEAKTFNQPGYIRHNVIAGLINEGGQANEFGMFEIKEIYKPINKNHDVKGNDLPAPGGKGTGY